MRTVEQRLARLQTLLPLLACPACGGPLGRADHDLTCSDCAVTYHVIGGVPILIPPELVAQGLGSQLGADENISKHPYSPASVAILEQFSDGLILDLGAGGKHIEHAHVVQVDVFRFPMTDVVASADCLPFKANVFDAVISQAVFEHLQYPDAAAEEVRRVLKVGGVAKIDTAFLQPEHAYPHHYFNATEVGLRHWFRNFDIQWSGVEPYQRPVWSMEWFLSDYLEALGEAAKQTVDALSVGQVVGTLRAVARGEGSPDDLQRFDVLADFQNPEANRRLAAGVSVRALKHVPYDSRCRHTGVEDLASERRAELLQGKLDMQAEWASAMAFAQKLAAHRSRWLALQLERQMELEAHLRGEVAWRDQTISALQALQKAPPLPVLFYWWSVSTLKKVLPRSLFERLRRQRAVQRMVGADSDPLTASHLAALPTSMPGMGGESVGEQQANWIHIEVTPRKVHDLLDQFFSLVYQSHSNWCLHLLEDGLQSASLKRVMHQLQASDRRVSVVVAGGTACEVYTSCNEQGWSVTLPPDAKLHPDALLEVANLARGGGEFRFVVGDSVHLAFEDKTYPLYTCPLYVCTAGKPEAGWPLAMDSQDLAAWPSFEKLGVPHASAVNSCDVARIPKVLFYRWTLPAA